MKTVFVLVPMVVGMWFAVVVFWAILDSCDFSVPGDASVGECCSVYLIGFFA